MTGWSVLQVLVLAGTVLGTAGLTAVVCWFLWHRPPPAPVALPPVVEHPTPEEAAARDKRDAGVAAGAGELDPAEVAGRKP